MDALSVAGIDLAAENAAELLVLTTPETRGRFVLMDFLNKRTQHVH